MDTNGGGLQLTIDQDGTKFTRVYRNSDAKDGMIIIGRASATYPNPVVPVDDPVGGQVVEKGTVAFYCPVMSRTHARLVFGSEGSVYISDPPDHSHHGTFITRGEENFKVGHPQRLETGDVITFGKPVHRGGDVYNPLTAVVRVLSGPTQNPSVRHATSFNGTGYTLPPDIDDQPPPAEEEELTSSPPGANELRTSKGDTAQADPIVEVNDDRRSNYQCFALDQGPSDMEDSDSDDSEIEELPAPPLADLSHHNHRSSVVCPIPSTWETPRPPRPSQAFIQSHQPSSPVISQSEGPPASGAASSAKSSPVRPADAPWRLLYGHTSQNDLDTNFPPPAGAGTPFVEWLSKFDAGLARTPERERDLDVAFAVLKEHRREVIDVDLEPEPDASHVSREVIDVDAFSTPEPPFAQNIAEQSIPILKHPEGNGIGSNDILPDEAGLPKTTIAVPHVVGTIGDVTPFLNTPQAPAALTGPEPDRHSQDEDVAGGQGDESQASDKSTDEAPTDALSEAAEHFQEFRIINECIKELSEKVDRLEGSRHRTKRRFALQKAAFNNALVTIDDEIAALKAGAAIEELKTFMQEMRGWKEELEKTLPRDDGTLGAKLEKVSKELDAMQEVVREKELVNQELQKDLKAAVEDAGLRVNGLHTTVDKMEESVASLKRKHDAMEQEDHREDHCSVSPSAPAAEPLCRTYTVWLDPEGNASRPVEPKSEVLAVPVAKRRRLAGSRRLARVATRLLVGGAIVYVGLGLV